MNQPHPSQEVSRLLVMLVIAGVLLMGAIMYLVQANGRSAELRSLEERLDTRLNRLEQHLPSMASSTNP